MIAKLASYRAAVAQAALALLPVWAGLVYLLSPEALKGSALFDAADGEPFAAVAAITFLAAGIMLVLGICARVSWLTALGETVTGSMLLVYAYALAATRTDTAWVPAGIAVTLAVVYFAQAVGDLIAYRQMERRS